MQTQDRVIQPAAPAFNTALGVWARLGLLSFGGPAAQIALMHRMLVEERGWLSERTFLSALSFCMLLPGPEAMQLATYAGWRLHGTKGGLAAGLLFVAPGALLVLALSMLYAAYGATPPAAALFAGVKAAVLAIVLQALIRLGKRALNGETDWAIAVLAFVAIFLFELPFPLVVFAAAALGYVRAAPATPAAQLSDAPHALAPHSMSNTLRTVALWLAIWILPLLAVALLFGHDHELAQLAWFFSKLAVVTFGGAYAVLAYMAQEVVDGYGWLTPGQMLDGLGLAETTNGPLILVTEFVGYTAAYHSKSGGIGLGLLGALVTLWATFAPCFLWIFAGAPYIERLTHAPRLAAALSSVTAAVVGVIANLSLWFALHVLFANVGERFIGPLRVLAPDPVSLNLQAAVLTALALVMVFVVRAGIAATLAVCCLASLAWLYLA